MKRLLSLFLALALLLGVIPVSFAAVDEELTRAIKYGFVTPKMASAHDSPITWKRFCEMAGRMIEAYDASALPAWQELTADAPDKTMKRDGGMVALLFAAKAVGLHTFNAPAPDAFGSYADRVWEISKMNYPVFPFDTPIDLGDGCFDTNHVGPAYDFCLRRVSPVSGKSLLEFDENGDLRLEKRFTVKEAGVAILRLYESGNPVIPVNPMDETEEGELSRAMAWGLVPAQWQDSMEQGITHAEFCALVRTLVERLKPERLSVWDETAKNASASHQLMERDDGAVGLFYAAQALECCTTTCWDHPVLSLILENPGSRDYGFDYPLWPRLKPGFQQYMAVPRTPAGTDSYQGGISSLIDAAYWFVLQRISPVNELPLMSYDASYNLRMAEPLTRREAAVYLWRLVEGVPNMVEGNHYIPVQETGGYDRSIITDALLSQPTELPDVTHSALPSEWKGFGLSKHKDLCIYHEFMESEVAFLGENGFNFARIFFGFDSLRYPDDPEDVCMVNETELRDLDRLIAWGMKHGVHIQLSMAATPSGLLTFEGMGEAEWDRISAYWEALARRYQGIPSRYLTFDLANEMQAGYETDAQNHALRQMEKIVQAVRKADPDRVLLISFPSNPAPIWKEGVAKLGLSLGCHPYMPEILCSGMEVFLKPAQNTYPHPYFPQLLSRDETVTIEGDIGGQVLWMDLWAYNDFRVTFDNGESVNFTPSQKEIGDRSEKPIEVRIPEGVNRLEIQPRDWDLRFLQIGIQPGLDSERKGNAKAGYLVPHDLWAADCKGGAQLKWDAENGLTSERECSPEFVYEHLITPQIRLAEKYHVGLMVNEMGSYAAGIGWDEGIKAAFDGDTLKMLEEHDISWAMCELAYILKYFPGQEEPWSNADWKTQTYTFEDGRRETITYSPELLEVYKQYTKP